MVYTGYTHRNNILTGLSCLIECGIIARSNKAYKYFINPLVVFNGDRVSFAKTYIKRKKEKVSSQQLSMFDKHEDVTDETQLENKASKRGLS